MPSIVAENKSSVEDTGLISAIPDAPLNGEEESNNKDLHSNLRQILIASFAAIALVGGTALYITRPWNPNAYVIHATQDADRSAEGNVAPVSHLSSQDTSENKKQQENAQAAANALEAYKVDLASYSQRADELRERLNKQLMNNDAAMGEQGEREASSLRDEFAARTAEMQGMELYSEELTSKREKLTLLAGYLQGKLNVLADAWTTSVRLSGTLEWDGSVRSVLAGASSEYSYQEWHDLFTNAYGTL
ncbi:MAG: hypothetical protein Q4B54_05480 [Coriobacteriales bacterium]|nr:hypothetical protein [Coriobacteriales bacterium]